jgi:hypothetical protein
LSASQLQRLDWHLSELDGETFRYFFVRDNCGFELIELLSVIDPKVRPPIRPWSLPIDALNAAIAAGIVDPESGGVAYAPSHKQVYRQAFSNLSRAERHELKAVVLSKRRNRSGAVTTGVRQLSVAALDAGVLYADSVVDATHREELRAAFLGERITRPELSLPTAERAGLGPEIRPHASSIALGGGYSGAWRPILRAQVGYQELTTQGVSRSEWGVFRVAKVEANIEGQSATLQSVELFAVEKFGTEATGLPGDTGLSWGLQVSPWVRSFSGEHGGQTGGQVGWFVDIGRKNGAFALGRTSLWLESAGVSLDAGPQVGLVSTPSPWLAVEVRLSQTFHSEHGTLPPVSAAVVRLGGRRRWNLRAEAEVGPRSWSVAPLVVAHW